VRALALVLAACSAGHGTATDGSVLDHDAPLLVDVPGIQLADCSHFASIEAHVAYLNQTRSDYAAHDRWRGIPWSGEYHMMVTFPLQLAAASDLAATAQAEAARVIGGGAPAGVNVPGQNGENREMWIDGINTAVWRITTFEYPGDWTVPMFGHERAALHPTNGSARMGFFYHDFGGAGPAITRMGVGAAVAADCRVAWVLQFAP